MEKNILPTYELVEGIRGCEQKLGKLLTVKWVKDNSDLGLKEAKELVDEYYFYPKGDD